MSLAVFIQVQRVYPVHETRLRQAAQTVLKQLRADTCSQVTIVVTDDDSLRDLNQKFRQVFSETDVLSFPAGPAPINNDGNDSVGKYLGDILIAYPYAKRVAQRQNLNVEDTLCMLLVHGLLHLLGYDHDTEAAKQAMWVEQARALATIGIEPAIVDKYGGEYGGQ